MKVKIFFGIILFSLSFQGCGKNEPKATVNPLGLLAAKAELYQKLSLELTEQKGYVHGQCDDLLFRSIAIFSGMPLGYKDHEDANQPGRWYRSADQRCYDRHLTGEDNGSKSDISRDMFVGLMLALQANNDKDNTSEIIDYALNNSFVMGRGDKSRTIMTPGLLWQYRNLNDSLGLVDTYVFQTEDFEAHLEVLRVFVDSLIFGSITDHQLNILKAQHDSQPKNALFQVLYHKFTDGQQQEAIDILLNEQWFPSGRLPNCSDRSTEYLWQRNDGSDWMPDTECSDVHWGVDFLFVHKLLNP